MKLLKSLVFASILIKAFAVDPSLEIPNQLTADSKAAGIMPKETNDEQAFQKAKQDAFPLTPKQIIQFHKLHNNVERAKTMSTDVPPKPTSSALVVNLEPGATPPVVRLSSGFISSLVFLDVTGAPWPIKAYDIGDPQAFSVQWEPQKNIKDSSGLGNTLLIQSNVMYKQGNLAVMLKGLNTPIMLTLVPGQKSVDYRVDIQVPKHGPYAVYNTGSLPSAASTDLVSVLNHISPPGAKSLTVKGGRAEAWLKNHKLYLRTPYHVISPSWYSTMSSSDGAIRAYSLQPASVVLALDHGKTITLNIGGI